MEWGTGRQQLADRRPGQPGLAAAPKVAAAPSDPSAAKPGQARSPGVSLPKSGGAIKGLGEKFSVSAATGTASLSVPLPLSPARLTPHLQLAYDSGSGNGPFGFGWGIDLPAITRKTDKGLPLYRDGDESDTFILSGSEDLVPILDAKGERQTLDRTIFGIDYQLTFYRPRIEGLFARIERWLAVKTGVSHWRSISRDNVTTLYGYDPGSFVVDPDDPSRVFQWNICRSWDDKGNVSAWIYGLEDSAGIDRTQAHEANRTAGGRAAQAYLRTIQYGNLQPYYPDWAATADTPLPTDWMFIVALDYGDHAASPPQIQPDRAWPVRPDPFSSYRAAFEVRTYRRVQRLLFFNNFPKEASAGANCLVRSLDLTYSDQQAPADPRNPIYTFLVSVTETGYRQDGSTLVSRSLPPLAFTYSQPQIDPAIHGLDRDSLGNLPEGIDGSRFHWLDLDGEGLSGILSHAPGGWFYKHNLSANNISARADGSLATRAMFGPMAPVAALPTRLDVERQHFLDLSGGGQLDVVSLEDPDPGFFKRGMDGGFEPFRHFAALPQIDWADPNIAFIDLTGDGLADLLMTEDGLFTWYASIGEPGFDVARLVRTPWDEEKGPKLVLSDGSGTIFIADMSGDGLNDIVRVRNGEACYWPNIGYGRFGAKVTMDLAPRFDNDERFAPQRIRLADIDGSGSADLLYIAEDGVRAWFNQSGNAWSAPTTIAVFPSSDRLSTVQAMDLLGTGTACLVWSSPLPVEATAPLLYVDLMGGQKPHLLVGTTNGLGAETRVTYAPSTRFYLADEAAGRPWITRLPFPVQVVERAETIDWIGRNRLVTRYAYHHGYFDGYEREFRGFGMVEQWDTEEFRADTAFNDGEFVNWDQQSWSPPALTRTWFHTGAFQQAPAVTRQYQSEYWIEPALRPASRAADAAAMELPDTVIPDGLAPYEIQEAYRALKGHALRVETYAEDGSANAANPYTVVAANFTIQCLQPMGSNLHAVFFVHPRESLSLYYERAGGDPRVAHEITLEADLYGDVTREVFIGYPRRSGYPPPEPALPAAAQSMLAYDQTRLHLRATQQQYTNAIDDLTKWPDSYRTPLPAESIVAEITGVAPSPKGNGITNLFSFEELDGTAAVPGIWQTAWTGAHDIAYEAIPASDIDGSGAPAAALTRRILAQGRTLYRSDDLTALLPQNTVDPLAHTGQSYQAVLTAGQLAAIFGALVPTATLTEGGYVQLAGDTGWWAPSSRVYLSAGDTDTPAQELATAKSQFFLPCRSVDVFGAVNRFTYDAYALLPASVTDPVGNVTAVVNDYRVLSPAVVTDPNGNQAASAFDALGMMTAMAVMGKVGGATLGDTLTGFVTDLDEPALLALWANPLADPAALLGNATSRIVYDVDAYQRTRGSAQPSPPSVYTLARETHTADLTATPGAATPGAIPGATPGATTQYQYAFAYSDGFGREIQRKARVADGPVTPGGAPLSPRWAGSGWTIFDNKGRPVRRFEPFFSTSNQFEFAAATGVSSIMFYDAPGRVAAVLHPDNTWEKVVYDAWRQQAWDGGDTVLIADPRSDTDVGGHFQQALGTAGFTSWYAQRIGGKFGATADDQAAQKEAAQKAAAYAATPQVAHSDTLGRLCLTVADNGGGARYATRTALDTEARPLAVFDALGQRAQEFCLRAPQAGGGFQYVAGGDMAGNPLYHCNADAGARRVLNNVAGRPIRNWDARGHTFRMTYDTAQRMTQRHVSTSGATETLIEQTLYGEGQAAANLCGRVFRHYDMTGYIENSEYDFKGNLLAGARQLAVDYQQAIDWTPLAGLTTGAALDAAAGTAGLIPTGDGGRDRFVSSAVYDALNRPIQIIAPHNPAMRPDVTRHSYDAGGNLVTVDAWLQQAAAPSSLLDPATADRHVVTAITYNARAQRLSVALGNGTTTTSDYDAQTFRLVHLTTTRPGSFAANQQTVQALAYSYDPVGNVTLIRDTADTQGVIYFNNQRVEPSDGYTYDSLYRLIGATGREHLGQTGGALNVPQQVTNDDSFRMTLPQPGDGNAMGVYTESYAYDPLGNLLTMGHQVGAGNWTRRYSYAETSQILTGETGNRLSATSLPGDPAAGPYSATYAYDPHGNMTRMPHLPAMTWDEDDRLRSTTRQVVNTGTPATTYYVYGAGGERVRKVSNGQAAAGQTVIRQSERIYLGGIEIYREYASDGTTVSLARETLPIAADGHTVATVETRTTGTDPAPAQLVRYQFGNHLGSAVLELDDQSGIISYEEYFPYGSSSYQAVANQTDLPKRYRYTGKERDAENDLYYHGARYYAPWLGRWTACDPLGVAEGVNLYLYAAASPVCLVDRDGMQSTTPHPEDTDIHQYWKEGTSKIGDSMPDDPPSAKSGSAKSGKASGPSVWDRIKDAAASVGKWIRHAASAVGKGLRDAATAVGHALKDAALAIAEGVKKGLSAIGDWAKGAATAIGDWAKGTAKAVGDWARNTATRVGDAAKSAASSVGNWFKKTATTVGNWTKHAASWVADHVQRGVSAAGKWIKTNVPLAWNATKTGVVKAARAVGSALVEAGKATLNVIGKFWSAPNTVVGLLILLVTHPFGGKITFEHNALVVNNFPFGGRAFTVGNVIFNPYPTLDRPEHPAYTAGEHTHLGYHEEAHTYQAELLGPLFYLVYVVSLAIVGSQNKIPFETAADVYGRTQKGWWP